ncbi:serine/threonine-protein kinase STY46-like [Dendronephthya gigantea]|uniref:serine/threonine-protein kinase STY46-like n=1 Tax=Dendronephthya gigantea TaxID=151771 RepID=UPI00106A862B|nr:serine/threonine-protein kinase STY46-like [Dendronephthya gigantea]
MAGAFKLLPSLLKSKTKADYGLPRFVWNQVKIERELASGAYGQVYIGKYLSTEERVVIKKLKSESGDAKKRFIKEAKMLNDLKRHDNISQFQAFCDNPFAIVMEYSVFDFNPFGPDKAVTTLEDFVHFVDDEYDFSSFHEIVPVCAKDIASGLDFLHKRNIAHRDLKPSNVLVSNLHYTSKQDQEL